MEEVSAPISASGSRNYFGSYFGSCGSHGTPEWRGVMNDEELKAYREAMEKGKYLTGLDIVLKAEAREKGLGTSDEEVYADIMKEIFGPKTKGTESEK
jgi:hypothetical protein